jgi:hypothetical protein
MDGLMSQSRYPRGPLLAVSMKTGKKTTISAIRVNSLARFGKIAKIRHAVIKVAQNTATTPRNNIPKKTITPTTRMSPPVSTALPSAAPDLARKGTER